MVATIMPAITTLVLTASTLGSGGEERVAFNRDIRPILTNACFTCHGPATRKGGFRLDVREEAVKPARSGARPIVAGKAAESEIVKRIFSTEKDEMMPPPNSHKLLKMAEKELIKKWINEGAAYQKHWSFEPPVKIAPLKINEPLHPIDRFVAARLRQEGLHLALETDGRTLIRRVSFALTGLPPTPMEVDAFLKDKSTNAYEKMVDRYLASKHYGEEMARHWLDIARYADTHGLQNDNERHMWVYRDWVVKAFNENLSFDQFTIAQLAGDLLPNPTNDQLVATGFNRCNVSTGEGGSIEAEWFFRYAVDRTNTMSEAFLGMTAGCAVCHDHKFDPISTKEYYSLYAFFNSTAESALNGDGPLPAPTIKVATAAQEQRLAELRQLISKVQQELADKIKTQKAESEGLKKKLLGLTQERDSIEKSPSGTLIFKELVKPRESFVMIRGQYDKPGEKVEPNTPAILPPLVKADPKGRATRLDLARWLVSAEHPLTSRVAVNRFWQQFFGTGLVKTSSDFGAQGDLPSHPELLDYLSIWYRENGWDTKALVRLMLTSATFRQSSKVTAELWKRDPANRLYARSPRLRLDAEQIRDNALFVSGLINLEMGGRGVRPYQPPRIWEPIAQAGSNTARYTQDKGAGLYRRSLYTFLKRSAPPPYMVNFDAPNRESLCGRRERSNTPLQSLQLLNDVQHFEAARKLGERMITEGGKSAAERIGFAYNVVLSRPPEASERDLVEKTLAQCLDRYQKDVDAAKKAIHYGDSPPPPNLPEAELAAYTLIANMILNLDETLTRN